MRLEVDGSMSSDGLMLSAYRNTDGTLAIVAINYGTTDQLVSIDTPKGKTATLYRTSDVERESLKNLGTVNLKRASLPARSVTTFLVSNRAK